MIDLNNPDVWNALLALVGGASLAASQRIFTHYTGPWLYTSYGSRRHSDAARNIYMQLRQCVDELEEVEKGRIIDHEGERLNRRALVQRNLARKHKLKHDGDVYEAPTIHQFPAIDYIVCYTNTDTNGQDISGYVRSVGTSIRRKLTAYAETLKAYGTNSSGASYIPPRYRAHGPAQAKIIAAGLAGTLAKYKKRVQAYSIGTDLMQIEKATPSSIIGSPRQSGFNLFQALRDLYSQKFENPTYIFFLMDSSPAVTDSEMEREALRVMAAHNNLVPVFIEIGRPHPPYTIRRIANFLDAIYINTPSNYSATGFQMIDAFKQAAKKMKEVVN